MPTYSDEVKAQAVARIRAGEATATQIAEEIGASHNTVKEWERKAERPPETDAEKRLADKIDGIHERIEAKQESIREKLLDRIEELVPTEMDLRSATTAYGIITDKQLLAQGKPTAITAEGIAIPADASALELRRTADELRRRMDTSEESETSSEAASN